MSQADVDAVLRQHARFVEGLISADADAIRTLADENVADMAPGIPVTAGKQAFDRKIQEILDQYQVEVKSSIKEAEASGNFAFVRADVDGGWIPKNGDPPILSTGKWLQVWKRQPDGEWKLLQNIWNRDQ